MSFKISGRLPVTLILGGVLVAGITPTANAAGPSDAFAAGATRISGPDRLATAISASKATFPDPAQTLGAVVLASSATYADAIGGGTLAATVGGPLLLTDPTSLRDDVSAEIERINDGAGIVFVLGGAMAVSTNVTDELEARGVYVERIAGTDRYDTAAKVARAVTVYGGSKPDTGIYLASGTNFPDGLAVAPLAAYYGDVVLLTDGDKPTQATTDYLAKYDPNHELTTTVGGPADRAYPGRNPIVGSDRYITAAALADTFGGNGDFDAVGLSTGENWPDALAAGAVLGQAGGGPLLLTNGSDLGIAGGSTEDLRNSGADVGLVFGGTKAVSQDVFTDFAARF